MKVMAWSRWSPGRAAVARSTRPADLPDAPGVIFGRLRHGRIGRGLRAHPVLVDSPLAFMIGLFAVGPIIFSRRGLSVGLLLITVAAAASLCLRRHFPVPTFIACAGAAFAQTILWAGSVTAFATFTMLLVEFYTVAKWCSRRATMAAAWTLVAWIALTAVALPGNTQGRIALVLLMLPLAVSAGVLGVNANTRRTYLASIADRAVRAERERDQQARIAAADERARIAREMHDIVAHNLSVMIALADGATFALRSTAEPEPAHSGDARDDAQSSGAPSSSGRSEGASGAAAGSGAKAQAADDRALAAARAVESISATGREALAQMRGLLGVLRDESPTRPVPPTQPAPPYAVSPPQLPSDPVVAPQPRLAELGGLIEQMRRAGLPVTVNVTGERRELTADAELTVFRIIQESLTNVLKHAGPGASAAISLRYDPGGVDVDIVDHGGAGPRTNALPPGGRGINGMRERAALHGGTLTASPDRGLAGGWRVRARINAASALRLPPAGSPAFPPGTAPSQPAAPGPAPAGPMPMPAVTPERMTGR